MTKRQSDSSSKHAVEVLKYTCGIEGLTPLMFDRFWSMDKKENATRPVEQKLYYDPQDGKTLVIPAKNWKAFLVGERVGKSCVKLFGPDKGWTDLAKHVAGAIAIAPLFPPICRDGAPIVFEGFSGTDYDAETGIYADHDNGWSGSGSKITRNELCRPVVPLPWHIKELQITIFPNEYVSPDMIREWFEKGGLSVGIGNHRPEYGRFVPTDWRQV